MPASHHAVATRRRRALVHAVRTSALVTALAASSFLAGCGGKSPDTGYAHPGIAVTPSSLQTAEGGANAPIDITLMTAPTSDVNLMVCASDATEGLVIGPSGTVGSTCAYLTFTTSNWSVAQTVQVAPVDDTLSDGNQAYTVTASVWNTLDTAYASVVAQVITVTNVDNDVPGFTVSKTTAATSEAGTTDTFTVRLNLAPTATVTIPVTSTDTTEGLLRGGNSPTTSQPTITLTFTTTNWNVPQTVTIYGQNDSIDDGNQTYSVVVGPPAGAAEYTVLVPKAVAVTNADDDTAGITVASAASPLVTSENGTTATFTVRINTQPTADVVVAVTSGNPAEGLVSAGAENLVHVAHLTFTALNWSVPQTVTVTGQDEVSTQIPGDNVTYDVTVGPATGDPLYVALATQAVHVLNTDNDTPTVIVPAAGGAPLQTAETGAGNTRTFTVAINKQPTTNVVIPVTVSDATEGLVQGGSSPAVPVQTLNVTFTPVDYLTAQTITVVGQVDNAVDGPQNYTITIGAPTGDPAYTSLPAQTVSVTNADSDVAGFTVNKTTIATTEGGAVGTFTVVLNRAPLADVVIPITSSNALEAKIAGGDSGGLFVASLNLTFTAATWQTPQTVQIQGQLDSIDDGNQPYTLTIGPTTSTSTPYNALAAKTIAGTNTDVDTAGFTVTPLTSLTVAEGSATASFTVKLNSKPLGTVNIPVNAIDSGQALVSSTGTPLPTNFLSLVFTASDWNVLQTVTVTAVDDAVADGDSPWSVSVGPTASSDTLYSGLVAKLVTGIAHDDDATDQGSAIAPIDISSILTSLAPYASEVGGGSSYYVLNGLAAGVNSISLSGVHGDVSLYVYSGSDFTTGLLCSSTVVGVAASEFCSFTAPVSGTVYILVSAAAGTTGAAYAIDANTRFGIVLFTNASYVDYSSLASPGYGHEARNMRETLVSLPWAEPVTNFTGITSAEIDAALLGKHAFVIPEQEISSLNTALTAAARSSIASFVSNGGTLVVNAPSTNGTTLLNGVFGFSTVSASVSTASTLNAAGSVGTPFAGGPASIPSNNATSGITTASLPPGSVSMYMNGSNAAVAVIPYGTGHIVVLGWDWFDAVPLGTLNGGWVDVFFNGLKL